MPLTGLKDTTWRNNYCKYSIIVINCTQKYVRESWLIIKKIVRPFFCHNYFIATCKWCNPNLENCTFKVFLFCVTFQHTLFTLSLYFWFVSPLVRWPQSLWLAGFWTTKNLFNESGGKHNWIVLSSLLKLVKWISNPPT